MELRYWIVNNVPDFELMSVPFSDKALAEMVSKYQTADIIRILLNAWSKGYCQMHRSAKVLFDSFAKNDLLLKAETERRDEVNRLYTYAEVLDFCHKNGVTQKMAFGDCIEINGAMMWTRKNC